MRGASPSAPLTIIKKISRKLESQPNVSSCPANFTPVIHLYKYPRNGKASQMCPAVQLTSHLYNIGTFHLKYNNARGLKFTSLIKLLLSSSRNLCSWRLNLISSISSQLLLQFSWHDWNTQNSKQATLSSWHWLLMLQRDLSRLSGRRTTNRSTRKGEASLSRVPDSARSRSIPARCQMPANILLLWWTARAQSAPPLASQL